MKLKDIHHLHKSSTCPYCRGTWSGNDKRFEAQFYNLSLSQVYQTGPKSSVWVELYNSNGTSIMSWSTAEH